MLFVVRSSLFSLLDFQNFQSVTLQSTSYSIVSIKPHKKSSSEVVLGKYAEYENIRKGECSITYKFSALSNLVSFPYSGWQAGSVLFAAALPAQISSGI